MTTATAYILYGLFALGGVGLYLAMPRPEGGHPRAGGLIGLAAVIGLLALFGVQSVGPASSLFFYIFAGIAVFTAGRVVTHPKPVYSAVYFTLVVLSVSGLLFLQYAEFLATALVIIYGGAILVTYAFVIMLAQQSGAAAFDVRAREPLAAVFVAFVAMGAVAGAMADLDDMTAARQTVAVTAAADGETVPAADPGALADSAEVTADSPDDLPATGEATPSNTLALGDQLFGPFVVAVELSGLLLLVAMVGAIAIARKRSPVDVPVEPVELGKVGREAKPF